MPKPEQENSYQPYQVPVHLYQALEKEAMKRRMAKGEDIKWSQVLREILDKWFKNN